MNIFVNDRLTRCKKGASVWDIVQSERLPLQCHIVVVDGRYVELDRLRELQAAPGADIKILSVFAGG